MALAYRVLETDSEIEQFTLVSCALVGNNVPVSYFRAGRVVGAFKGDKLVGGWAIAYPSRSTLRCTQGIPYSEAAKNEINDLIARGLLCEATQIFLAPGEADGRESVSFWKKFASDMLANAAPKIIFGFKRQNEGLARLYGSMSPKVLYSGPVIAKSDLKTHAEATMMLISRDKLRYMILINLGGALKRLILNKRSVQRIARSA